MIEAFAEAVRATAQPCTFVLVVPVAAAVALLGASWHVIGAALASAVAGGWLVAANWWILDGGGLQVSAMVVAAGAIAASWSITRTAALREPVAGAAAASVVTLLATHWWRPCVGEELGVILTSAQGGLAGQLPGMAAYMVGAMAPVVIVALVIRVFDAARIELIARPAGVTLGIVAGVLAVGRHDELVAVLARWSV